LTETVVVTAAGGLAGAGVCGAGDGAVSAVGPPAGGGVTVTVVVVAAGADAAGLGVSVLISVRTGMAEAVSTDGVAI